MAGFTVPVVRCEEHDFCEQEFEGSEGDTLSGLRNWLRERGWCFHNDGQGRRLDYCPVDGCCPWHSSEEALAKRVDARF